MTLTKHAASKKKKNYVSYYQFCHELKPTVYSEGGVGWMKIKCLGRELAVCCLSKSFWVVMLTSLRGRLWMHIQVYSQQSEPFQLIIYYYTCHGGNFSCRLYIFHSPSVYKYWAPELRYYTCDLCNMVYWSYWYLIIIERGNKISIF